MDRIHLGGAGDKVACQMCTATQLVLKLCWWPRRNQLSTQTQQSCSYLVSLRMDNCKNLGIWQ
jgi:hypothetical protein